MTLKAIIVDDERLARSELKKMLQEYPDINVIDEAANADEGIDKIETQNPDIVFLDIQMPQLLGTDFMRSLINPPKVIFTTAFRKYAVDGFELDAVDCG